MYSISCRALLAATICILVCATSPSNRCFAQWVPNPGEGSVSLGYQFTRITDHLFSQNVDGIVDPASGYVGGPGKRYYMGDVDGQTVNLALNYGVWRGLAVSALGAYVTSRYVGRFPEGPVDDGHYHGSLQDASVTLEYMFAWQEFAITPMVGARVPMRNYPTLGHVSVGKDLREYPVGLSLGRSLDPLLPRAFLTAAFAYSFVEDHHEHSLDQRHFDAGAGYLLSNTVTIGGSVQYVNTIDGLDWFSSDLSGEEEWHDHDASAKSQFLRAGGFASFAVGHNLGVRLSYLDTISGENSHDGQSLTIATTWNFRTPFGR